MRTYKGTVQRGTQRAAALGFPTINIPLTDTEADGIYAAKVRVKDRVYEAAAFADQSRGVLEAHLLDFSDELANAEVTIELLKKIRDNETFPEDEALRAAIARDVVTARHYFDSP